MWKKSKIRYYIEWTIIDINIRIIGNVYLGKLIYVYEGKFGDPHFGRSFKLEIDKIEQSISRITYIEK